MFSNNRYNLKS